MRIKENRDEGTEMYPRFFVKEIFDCKPKYNIRLTICPVLFIIILSDRRDGIFTPGIREDDYD